MSQLATPAAAATTTRLRRAYVDTPVGQVHYHDSGVGEPVLLLHESPSSSLQFQSVWPHLIAAGFRVLGMDTPGFGQSDVPAREPTIADYASVIPYVLDQAGVDRTHVVGHHTGVEVACEAAGLFPERFRKLVGHGVPLFTRAEAREWWDRVVPREQNPPAPRPDGSHLAERFAASVQRQPGVDLQVVQRTMLQTLQAGPMYWYGHNAAFLYDMEPRLRTLTLPMLFLSNQGEMIHDLTLRAHALRPDAQLVVLEAGPSNAIDLDPAGWTAAVTNFLRS